MEWVETTGRTIEEARDAALEQLGVAEEDAEIQVLSEPKPGLFGRMRGEARIRARVMPAPVRPKEDRRDRRRRRSGSGGSSRSGGVSTRQSETEPLESSSSDSESDRAGRNGSDPDLDDDQGGSEHRSGRRRRRSGRSGSRSGSDGNGAPEGSENGEREATSVPEDVALEDQAAGAVEFLSGLVDRLGMAAEVESELLDEETVEVRVTGSDLGILIGPRGDTLAALQELTRTVVQRRLGAHNGRLLVDVSGYRQKRRAALERFTREVADQVRSTGQRRVLEPMSPADRKVVHDTINEIDGLTTTSEGEEPRRRVV